MKEKLYTIPLNDAFMANDECPFCYVERNVEQDLLDFVLGSGSSYMESDVRDMTDRAGFCRTHFKKMFDYGNTLGNGWILKTHYMRIRDELKQQTDRFTPGKTKSSPFSKMKKASEAASSNSVVAWVREKERSCYICNQFDDMYERYLDTFFHMYKTDSDFRDRFTSCKGFCLSHFGDLCEAADSKMNDKEKATFLPILFERMNTNMSRIQEDVNWLIEKFDYRNNDADWKTSKDAVQRGMQKLKGGYHADPVYKSKK